MKSQWEALYDTLKAGIVGGRYAPGDRLPAEHELSAANDVSRNTVRRAFLALSQEGLIRIVNGRGSYVMQSGIVYEIDAVSRFRDVLERQGVESGWRVIDSSVIEADLEIAGKLALAEGVKVLRYTTLILGNRVPLLLATRFFPLDLLHDFEMRLARGGSFTALLREEGLGDLHRVSTTVGARMPKEEEADLLECPRNAPLLDATATGRLDSGRLVEWQHAVMNGQFIRLSFNA